MRLGSFLLLATLAVGIDLLVMPSPLFSQQSGSVQILAVAKDLPEAPQPQFLVATVQTVEPLRQETSAGHGQSTQQPGTSPASQGSSSSQTPAPQTSQQIDPEKSKHERAEEQIKEQEHQRILGILPAFNTSYRSDAVSLTAGQKMRLALRSEIDPEAFVIPFFVAGYHEALDEDKGFGWGLEGLGKRAGASYLDHLDGTIIGSGILPSILHQDPRYFRLGHGSITHRTLYSLATNVICKHDNTGKWEPNYSNIAGNIASGAISNLYYPSSNSGIGQTFSNGFIVTAEGGADSLFQEFWPDFSRRFFHKDPTGGRDAAARALDTQEKEARKEAKEKAKQQ
jgi:hypothetical protein